MNILYYHLPPCTSRIKLQGPVITCFLISAARTPVLELTDELRLNVSMVCFYNCRYVHLSICRSIKMRTFCSLYPHYIKLFRFILFANHFLSRLLAFRLMSCVCVRSRFFYTLATTIVDGFTA
jgi:hypothetical protein